MTQSGQTRSAATGGARILHISADFPDPLAPGKTRAVSNLLDLTDDVFRHSVYSINRTDTRLGIAALPFGADWRAVAYGAPPRGLFLKTYLDRLADWILRDVRDRGMAVDLVHAHKLSTDGLVGAAVARGLGVPLVVSSQGNSDLKILGARRDLRGVWRGIWHEAAVVFPFAPWTARGLEARLGPRAGPTTVLPCPTIEDRIIAPRHTDPVFRTAFHLRDHRNKNAVGLIQAVAVAAREVPEIRLEIAGGGDATAFATLTDAIRRHAPNHARLLGPIPHARIQEEMNAACGFVMVSGRESYGMVYAEALLAGAPVIHNATNGIAGYFPDCEAVVGVAPGDTDALAAALVAGARRQDEKKATLKSMQDSGALSVFTRPAIRDAYVSALSSIL